MRPAGHCSSPPDPSPIPARFRAFILVDWLVTDGLRARLHLLRAEGTGLVCRECAKPGS